MSRFLKLFALFAVVGVLTVPAVRPAEARTHVFVGLGLGVPAYPAYYPPPPVYYPPPPVYYAPPPPPVVVYTPPQPAYTYAPPAPAPAAPPAQASSNCRTYNGDATIDASGKPFYGTACQGPDGRWHIQ